MKITKRELRSIILKETRSRRGQPSLSSLLLEASPITSSADDLNTMDAGAVWDAMVGGDDTAAKELIAGIGTATENDKEDWAPGGLKSSGLVDAESLKSRAEEIWGQGDEGKSAFTSRINSIKGKLGASQGFAKPEMPALEGDDIDAVEDAFDEEGEINIDIGEDWGGGTKSFSEYEKVKRGDGSSEKEKEEKEEKTESRHRSELPVILERWQKLAGLNEINDDERFPFDGPGKVMKGAPNLGDSGKINIGAIGGVAKDFLTKGKGNAGDDIKIAKNQPMTGAQMKPTQTNIKAAKSMLFALLNIGAKMGGAFASSDGEIIDGHHRWSGQYLRHGDGAKFTNVHIIDKNGMNTKEFLTMLTVTGNALGRPTKK